MAGSFTLPTVLANLTAGNQALSLIDGDLTTLRDPLLALGTFANYYTDTGAANAYAITVSSPQTVAQAAGLAIQFKATNANTGASTFQINALTVKNIVNPDGTLLYAGQIPAGAVVAVIFDGTNYQIQIPRSPSVLPRSYLAGLAMANGTDAVNDIDFSVGTCRDSGNVVDIILASVLTKQLDAAWAVGTNAGMRATGAAITDTTYHIFLIRRPDTAVVDIAADTSVTGANIATNTNANYTQIRRIGSIVRTGASIKAFIQDGDKFVWTAGPVADVNANNPGTGAVTRTLTLPIGIRVEAILGPGIATASATNPVSFRVSDLSATDVAASATTAQVSATYPATGNTTNATSECRVYTNTSAQVRSRASLSDANVTVIIGTTGWVDRRGRDD